MPHPVGDEYKESPMSRWRRISMGKLLPLHGDLDHNVNVAETLRLVNALIQAKKDFEMVLVPNMYHGEVRICKCCASAGTTL